MRLLCFFLVLLMAGCATSDKKSAHHNMNFKEYKENQRFDNTDLKRQVFDMNHDGQVDLWKFYGIKKAADDDGEGQTVIVRKELDLNFDGTIDRIMYYNQKENLIREEIDSNFDGMIDRIHYYDNALVVRTEIFTASCNQVAIDGQGSTEVNPNILRHYHKGKLTREELDEACDGKREIITLFNENGDLAQIGYDRDGDGAVEEWVRY